MMNFLSTNWIAEYNYSDSFLELFQFVSKLLSCREYNVILKQRFSRMATALRFYVNQNVIEIQQIYHLMERMT